MILNAFSTLYKSVYIFDKKQSSMKNSSFSSTKTNLKRGTRNHLVTVIPKHKFGLIKKVTSSIAVVLVISMIFLSACGVSGTAVSESSGTLENAKVKEVSNNDRYISVESTIPINAMEVNGGGMNLGIPINLTAFGGRFGSIELAANYPFTIWHWNWDNLINPAPLTNDVNRFQGKIMYGYPVFSFLSAERKVYVRFGEYDDKKYSGVVPSSHLNSINIRAGVYKDYARNGTLYHDEYLREQYESVTLFTQDELLLRQSNFGLTFGASFQRFIDLILEGNGDGKDFKGRKTDLVTLYVDINLMLGSSMDQVYLEYFASNPSSGLPGSSHAGPFDFRDILSQRRVGISFGADMFSFVKSEGRANVTQSVEAGLKPGYFVSAKEAWYLRYGIRYGLGWRSRK